MIRSDHRNVRESAVEATDAVTREIMKDEIQIVVPAGMFGASDADSMLDKILREIAVAACAPNGDDWFPMGTPERNAAKYGVKFENDVFFMCPDYMDVECNCGQEAKATAWCEANECADTCYFSVRCSQIDEWEALHPEAKYDEQIAAETAISIKLCERLGIPWNDGRGSAVHCSCGRDERAKIWFQENKHAPRCPVALPNFWFKPTDLRVEWYKYIGREVEVNRALELTELVTIHEQCIASIST